MMLMLGKKWLSEAVHADEIEKGVLNIVCAPVGSGKTTWALDVLSNTVSSKYKMLYLIDTKNGKEQLLKHPATQYCSKSWADTVSQPFSYFYNVSIFVYPCSSFNRKNHLYQPVGQYFYSRTEICLLKANIQFISKYKNVTIIYS